MIKLRGFGGKTEFWEHNLESFTLMSGLAAVTSKIKIFATVATLTIPPAIAARMASTIDSIAPGRFGLNLVTGWQKAEYSQMGLWPGEEHYTDRYNYLAEYTTVLKDLLETGRLGLQGQVLPDGGLPGQPAPQGNQADLRRLVRTRAWPSRRNMPTTASPWARAPTPRPPSARSMTA
jgi:alkanesulfonate monooxygenase SsuD/methylene tetrahydromethanopterin reductase-like flavin-dependent oxidoreductase (luciferase family)